VKRNWWLEAQTLGLGGIVVRAWPLAKMLEYSKDEFKKLEDLKITLPPATIIVPARNEARNIERCVRSLLAQDYPDFELIVVNDGSTDKTPEILARLAKENPRLKVLNLEESLPPGWAGKPHAMQRGYEAARPQSEWFLFSDADTFHQPAALRSAITGALQEKADMLSLLPKMELKSFWEKLLLPFAVLGITLQYPLDKVNEPNSKLAIANGQFLLIRRDAFEKVGGYGGPLKSSLLDDRDMALAVKSQGGRLILKNGQELLAVRMYTGLGEIWRGFRKNAFVGSRAAYISVPLFIVAGIGLGVLPFLQLIYALLSWAGSGGRRSRKLLGYSLFQVTLLLIARQRLDRTMGVPLRYSLFAPLSTLVFMGILLDSMIRSFTGRGLSWKGRIYSGAAKTQQIIKF
jgi:chlorobactene glucosyltransferase